jgi:hypothetical protein
MEEWIVKDIFLKAKKSLEKMNGSLRLFKEFVEEGQTQELKKYYLARPFLKRGQKFYEEMMEDAKKFSALCRTISQQKRSKREFNSLKRQRSLS